MNDGDDGTCCEKTCRYDVPEPLSMARNFREFILPENFQFRVYLSPKIKVARYPGGANAPLTNASYAYV